jgi:hypothetical protein
VHRGHAVHRSLHLRAEGERDDGRGADRQRADVGQHAHAQREDAAFAVERQAGGEMLVASHVRTEEFLAALAAPAHRPAELARRVAHQRVLRREPGLHAEAAADVAVHDAEILRLGAKHRAKQLARAGRRLVLRVKRGACAVEQRDAGARLHRHGDHPLVVQLERGDVGGFAKNLIHKAFISILSFRGDIAAGFRPHQRRTRCRRGARIAHAGQILVLDPRELGGVLSLRARAGDDRRDRLPHVAHGAFGERRTRRRRHGRAVGALEPRGKRDMADAVGAQLGHAPGGERARRAFHFT